MGAETVPLRSLFAKVLAAAVVLAVAIPSVALAANTATFTSPVPAAGSTTSNPRPAISLSGYDRYGVRAGGVSMWVGGVRVTPKFVYTNRGSKSFRLACTPPSALPAGLWRVTVKVHDLRHRNSTRSWTFTVREPPLPAMPLPGTGTECGDCHSAYTVAHPMTDCEGCHNPLAPPRPGGGPMRSYKRSEVSAHASGCASAMMCHGDRGAFLHVAGTECARCHTGSYPGIPGGHAGTPEQIEAHHLSAASFCVASACHVGSLTVEHYRRVVGGVRLSCATCHASPDPAVRDAITAGSTACTECHRLTDHPGASAKHAAVTPPGAAVDCLQAGCHAGNLVAIHERRCEPCHANASHAATSDCRVCHATGEFHATLTDAHSTVDLACRGPACHGVDVAAVHDDAPLGCRTCHGDPGRAASKSCPDCHSPHDLPVLHAAAPAPQTITINSTAYGTHACSECHSRLDLRDLHRACGSCHTTAVAIIVGGAWNRGCVQGGCHASTGASPMHAALNASHTTTAGVTTSCGGVACHGSVADAAAIHASHGGCADCHGASKTPSLVCSRCHTPHDLTALHAASPTSQTITINSVGYSGHPCSECHSPLDLRTLHRGCTTCHTTDVNTTLGGAWTRGCVQGGCHAGTGSIPMHAALNASHTTTAGVTTSCGGVACHGVVVDVAVIHAEHGGCAVCHGADRKPSLTCTDSGCHPGGAPEAHVVYHVGCNGCHGRTLASGGLHDNPIADPYGSYGYDCALQWCHGAPFRYVTAHSYDSGCRNCH